MQIWRQQKHEAWRDVIARVKVALSDLSQRTGSNNMLVRKAVVPLVLIGIWGAYAFQVSWLIAHRQPEQRLSS